MRKVVINSCFGGFSLSPLAEKMYFEKKNPGKTVYFYKRHYMGSDQKFTRLDEKNPRGHFIDLMSEDFGPEFMITKEDRDNKTEFYKKFSDAFIYFDYDVRHDPDLIEVVELLGPEADGECSSLQIIDIGDKLYRIEEYDGKETLITPDDEYDWL